MYTPDLTRTASIPVECPRCRHESEYALARLQIDAAYACSLCGQETKLSSETVESITRVFREPEKQLRRLVRQLDVPQLQIPG